MNSYASISQLLGLSFIGNEAADRRNIESAVERLLSRRAEVEGELSTSNAQLASVLQKHKADIREMGRLLEDERCKVVTVEGELDALREKAELLDWLLKEGFHHADVSIGDDEGRKPIVYFRITFEIPEPKDWPKYDDEEWRDSEVLAALRAAKENAK